MTFVKYYKPKEEENVLLDVRKGDSAISLIKGHLKQNGYSFFSNQDLENIAANTINWDGVYIIRKDGKREKLTYENARTLREGDKIEIDKAVLEKSIKHRISKLSNKKDNSFLEGIKEEKEGVKEPIIISPSNHIRFTQNLRDNAENELEKIKNSYPYMSINDPNQKVELKKEDNPKESNIIQDQKSEENKTWSVNQVAESEVKGSNFFTTTKSEIGKDLVSYLDNHYVTDQKYIFCFSKKDLEEVVNSKEGKIVFISQDLLLYGQIYGYYELAIYQLQFLEETLSNAQKSQSETIQVINPATGKEEEISREKIIKEYPIIIQKVKQDLELINNELAKLEKSLEKTYNELESRKDIILIGPNDDLIKVLNLKPKEETRKG